MSAAKANKGKTEVTQPGYYLLGRPYNKDGVACGGYIPLRHYAVAVTVTDTESKTTEHKGAAVTTIPATGLVVSDNNGLLKHPNREARLNGTPLKFQEKKAGSRQGKALFFPSHMIPMAYACFEENWLKKLHSLLEDKNSLTHSSDVSLRIQSRGELRKFCAKADSSATDKNAKDYAQWHAQQFTDNNGDQLMGFIEIPQLYTIVVVFSSAIYAGATVSLSQFPKELRFAGNKDKLSSVKKATSIVNEVSYLDHEGTQNVIHAATFWLEGNLPQQLNPSEQYCRFDVDLSTVSDDEEIEKLAIPQSYSLMEQVLHLPISTIAGRTSLVNGDPISVEEALVNHCPQYFSELMGKMKDSAYLKPEDVKLSNDKAAPEGVWHHLQTYKSYYECLASSAEKGITVGTISKLINASLSQFDPDGEATKLVKSVSGVSGAAKSYIEVYTKFKPDNIGNLAKGVKSLAEKLNFIDQLDNFGEFHLFPEHLRPFASKLGSVFGTALGKPLSILELGYNMHDAVGKSGKAGKAEAHFFATSKVYTSNTTSYSTVLSEVDKAQAENKKKAIIEVKKNLAQVIENGEKQNTITRKKTKAGDSEVQLLSLSFKFNSSGIVLGEEGQAIMNEIVEFLVLVDPIPIKITGHACRIGTDQDNNEIAQQRADAFAALLCKRLKGKIDDDILSVWKQQIQTISMGSSVPVDRGVNEENLAKNRRVEVIFMLDRYVQNPPCRSGMLALEASRKGAVAASVSEDQAWIDTAKGGLDLAVGLGAALMGPAAIFAYSCYAANNMLQPALSGFEQAMKKNGNYLNDLKRFAEFDMAGQNLMLKQDELLSPSAFMNKAYLKRGLALNGLIRLIHRYYYEKEAVSNYRRHFPTEINSRANGNKAKTFDSYDIGGYIQHFLLRDDWNIGNDNFALHLDEYWLDQKGNAANYSSFASWIGGAAYVWNRMWQEDHSKKELAKGQQYQQHLPIHYMSSSSLDYFKALFATEPLKFGDKDIIKSLVISARPRGSDGKWMLLNSYLNVQHHRCLSPYDQIRVLVVLNKANEKLNSALNPPGENKTGAPVILPIAVRAVRHDFPFNDKAAPTSEYAIALNRNSLCDHEVKILENEGGADDIFGAIINPKFSLGRNVLAGTRPMADYEDGLLRALFDDNNGEKSNHYNTPAQVFSMRYFYECYIPGSDDTEQPVHLNEDKSRYQFNLRLDPKREYELQNKQDKSSYTVQDDYHFYAKNFLEADTIEQSKVIYPRVFEDTKLKFSVYQDGKIYESTDGIGGKFDWNKATEIELVARTISQGTDKLKNQGFELNSLPIQVMLGNSYKIEQAKTLYRIGKIENKADKWLFTAVDIVDKNLVDLASKYKKMTQEDLKLQCIAGKPTDIFAFHVSMSYINAVGTPKEGLKPFGYRMGGIFGSNKPHTDVVLSVSSAGLDKVETENKISFPRLLRSSPVPENWLAYNKDDEILVKRALEVRDSYIDDLKDEGKVVDRKLTKLMAWIKAEDDNSTKNDIIDAWMLGED
jgi:outer membrane protein OmpA-like peptidoglycan-associated protein